VTAFIANVGAILPAMCGLAVAAAVIVAIVAGINKVYEVRR
jgi:hypothetical protein